MICFPNFMEFPTLQDFEANDWDLEEYMLQATAGDDPDCFRGQGLPEGFHEVDESGQFVWLPEEPLH